MNDALTKYREQLKRLSGEFTAGQKAVVVLAVAAVLVGAVLFSRMSPGADKVVLYANLDPADAAAVTEQLTSSGVPYELVDGGGTVMVPQDQAAQARIDLAAQDLPSKSDDGWSIIDNQGMTTSEFRQRIDYQRALEGELSATIEALEPVESAMVRLVVPRNDVFASDTQKPTASVLVTTAPGETLSSKQVSSIVNLTAGAVPGLAPEDVTVTDASGQLLAAPGMDAAAGGADANGSATGEFEAQLGSGVTELLSPVFGSGKVRVQVSAQLDYSKRESVSETVQAPNPAVVTDEKTGEESLTGTGGIETGGVLGPDGLPITGAGGDTNYTNNTAERSYAVGKLTETVKAAPGAVERLSIAVVVDQDAAADADLAEITDLVGAATGVDAQRGDTVQVTRLPFDNTAAEEAEREREKADADAGRAEMIGLARTVVTWLVVGLVVLLIWRSVRRARMAQLAALAGNGDDDDEPEPKPAPPRRDDPPEPDDPTEEELEQERLEEKVRTSSEVLRSAPPSDLAAVMRNWAQEG